MAYYQVMLRGEGISVPAEDGAPPIIGFYTTRIVRASSADGAIAAAQQLVLAEWTTGSYAVANRGALPRLSVESVGVSGFLAWVTMKNRGCTFYAAD
jgi:hypothetical protein